MTQPSAPARAPRSEVRLPIGRRPDGPSGVGWAGRQARRETLVGAGTGASADARDDPCEVRLHAWAAGERDGTAAPASGARPARPRRTVRSWTTSARTVRQTVL